MLPVIFRFQLLWPDISDLIIYSFLYP